MPIVEISVVPVGTNTASVSRYVRTALEIIKNSGLNYSVNPMGTCIEGDWETIFQTIRQIHEKLTSIGCPRLITTIKIDDRRDKQQTMQDKVKKVTT